MFKMNRTVSVFLAVIILALARMAITPIVVAPLLKAGLAEASEVGYGMVIDSGGNMYISGVSSTPSYLPDVFAAKVDDSWNIQWARIFRYGTLVDYDEKAYDAAIDSSGNIYMVGEVTIDGLTDVLLFSLDGEDGSVRWSRVMEPPSGFLHTGYGVAINSLDMIYITGEICPLCAPIVANIRSDGYLSWYNYLQGLGEAKSYGITIDSSDNIYITGVTYITGEGDTFVAKLDDNGNPQWTVRIPIGGEFDAGYGIAIDSSDSVYITGEAYMGPIATLDVFVAKLDDSGNLLWAETFGGPGYDAGYGITLDSSDNIYVTGKYWYAGGYECFVAKYSNPLLWFITIGGSPDGEGRQVAAHLDKVLAVGSSSGELQWNNRSVSCSVYHPSVYSLVTPGFAIVPIISEPTPDITDIDPSSLTGGDRDIILGRLYQSDGRPELIIESSDSSGKKKDKFSEGDSVYAYGSGYAASTTHSIYVVSNTAWTDGMPIPPRVPGTSLTVTTDGTGRNAPDPTLIWASAIEGKYDIIVDVNEDGFYNATMDPLDDMDVKGAGFIVPESPLTFTLITSVATCVYLLIRGKLGGMRRKLSKER